MKKVFVKGWIEDRQMSIMGLTSAKRGGHHSMPVRFKTESGGYEWLWVRKNNVKLCRAPSAPGKGEGRGK